MGIPFRHIEPRGLEREKTGVNNSCSGAAGKANRIIPRAAARVAQPGDEGVSDNARSY